MPNLINLKGERYGKLVAIKRVPFDGPTRWLFSCDCGNKKEIDSASVRKGRINSCGCLRERLIRDITNKRYGKLVAIKRIDNSNPTKWLFKCDCGNFKELRLSHIKYAISCGCIKPNYKVKHGHCSKGKITSTYKTWRAMIKRCNSDKLDHFKSYKGKGITVCEKWVNSFEAFLKDMGKRPTGKTLDRIDNDKGYCPENCRWASYQVQSHNRKPCNDDSSKYKGVCKLKNGLFKAQIRKDRAYNLGFFKSEIEAAKVYDLKAKELYGEYAYLNFPCED